MHSTLRSLVIRNIIISGERENDNKDKKKGRASGDDVPLMEEFYARVS